MAHRTEKACVINIRGQVDTNYTCIIAWKKDWERWSDAILAEIPKKYERVNEMYTRNQIIVGRQHQK